MVVDFEISRLDKLHAAHSKVWADKVATPDRVLFRPQREFVPEDILPAVSP